MPAPRILVYSHDGAQLFELDENRLVSASRVEEINGEHSLSLTTFQTLEKEQRVLIQDATLDWREYVVAGAESTHDAGANANVYYCVWSLQHDLAATKVNKMPGIKEGAEAADALSAALSGTDRWNVGNVTLHTVAGASMYYMSGWDALSTVVDVWGGEVSPEIAVDSKGVVSRSVNLYEKQGNQTPTRRFDYGDDMSAIKRIVADEPFVCRIIPRGKGEETEDGYGRRITIESVNEGIEWLEDAEAVPIVRLPDGQGGWEYPTLIVVNENIDDPQALKDWALEHLHDWTRPKVTYEASVVQFSEAGLDSHGLELGDAVQCVDKSFCADGLRVTGRIVKMKVNELDRSDIDLEIGFLSKTLASQFQSMQASIDSVSSRVSQMAGDMSTPEWIDGLIDRINREANATGGYTYIVQGDGIRTYDKEVSDPSEGLEADAVVEIKGGTIRIANSRDGQGQWEWRTVFTADHIAGDMVTAAEIVTGYIGSADGDVYINLDTGEVHIQSIESQLEQTADAITLSFGEAIEQSKADVLDTVDEAYAGKEDTEAALDAVNAKADETAQALAEEIDARQTYYRFDADAMTIGKTDSELQLQLANDRISFLDQGEEVAYASGGEFFAPNMAVENQLRMNKWAWIPRSNDNLSLKWLGD